MHAIITAVVVIGTGNHWILDVAVGWAVVIVAMWLVDPYFLDRRALADVRVEFRDRTRRGRRASPRGSRPRLDERPVQECRPRSDPDR